MYTNIQRISPNTNIFVTSRIWCHNDKSYSVIAQLATCSPIPLTLCGTVAKLAQNIWIGYHSVGSRSLLFAVVLCYCSACHSCLKLQRYGFSTFYIRILKYAYAYKYIRKNTRNKMIICRMFRRNVLSNVRNLMNHRSKTFGLEYNFNLACV